jgi:hypothetical protein
MLLTTTTTTTITITISTMFITCYLKQTVLT